MIRRDEGLGRPERAARAYTLLGFTNQGPAFDLVWSDFDHRRPTMGWLIDVYRTARRAYCRNVWARHWCRCYLEASDPATAFAAYELLASTLDSRAWLWLRPELDDMPPTAWLRAHWDMNLKRLDDISKASENELKDKLFATRTMARTHAPWL